MDPLRPLSPTAIARLEQHWPEAEETLQALAITPEELDRVAEDSRAALAELLAHGRADEDPAFPAQLAEQGRAALEGLIAAAGRDEQPVKNLDLPAGGRHTTQMATVELTPKAAGQAERLPKRVHQRVLALIARLEDWPEVSGVKRLSGNLAGWCRLRTGDYRIRFRVQGDRITVDQIGHRRDFYEH